MEVSDNCTKCRITLRQALDIFSYDITAIDFLQCHGAVPTEVVCSTCNKSTMLRENLIWKCQRRNKEKRGKKYIYSRCNFFHSWRKETWFSNAHLPLTTCCQFIVQYLLLSPPHEVFLENEFGVGRSTIVDWTNFIRETLIYWSEKNTSTTIGGPNITIEIDEAKFGKRKYNRGRIIDGTWCFGGFERNSRKFFVESVKRRDINTLEEIIKRRVKPGSIIISDCWKAYNNLSNLGYRHLTVNHSQNFIDPGTGAHTQNIERSWCDMRGLLPKYGRKEEHMAGYIAEFMFRRTFPDHCERAHEFFSFLSTFHFDLMSNTNDD